MLVPRPMRRRPPALHARPRRALGGAAVGLGLAAFAPGLGGAGCARQATERTVLQTDDLVGSQATFDRNGIVDLASFTDWQSITGAQVQQFLERTPYNRGSFLGTYQSNGIRAADAILRTAARYKLNPLVFLARAEMAQGLVGEEFYPAPPSRVEYVFGCGCVSGQGGASGACNPALAGFDTQVDCLGRALRTSLDDITSSGATAGQWAPGQARLTLDNLSVTPADASTAALYQYTPVVAFQSAGGNWLFWNLWQKYALAVGYFGGGSVATGSAFIGDACKVDATCAYAGGICTASYPGGLCTAACTGDCIVDPAHGPTFCADFQAQGGYCLAVCNPDAPACRTGYACKKVAKLGDSAASANVCLPL